ncbi:MAG: class I SAM-dependent methyltransferase [Alphaproteobacteria bacterium]|nr:class I SAM-dependent methyltransferase [Alphaproteobacteria bacterium]MDX5370512.1 class I SAM-dependent methyltransferase [Alphaproteobacteria bacterium]
MAETGSRCCVCGSSNLEALFEARGIGFTLAQRPNDLTTTSAALCLDCSHVQTPPLEDIAAYYDTGYEFQLSTAEEDDIYQVLPDGTRVFRSEHQAASVAALHDLTPGLRVLDYGCGKARTLALLARAHPDIAPFTFDVSDIYTPLWDAFVPKDNQAAYRMPETWRRAMDLVLSFFALEHTADPRGFVRDLAQVVRPGGKVHVVIPNMYRNISDLVVIDHAQHFSPISLRLLFEAAGYADVAIDDQTHRAAFIVTATRPEAPAVERTPVAEAELEAALGAAREVARTWAEIARRIETFEADRPEARAVIYGSGVYGMFVASTLRERGRVRAFLDMNPFRQGRELMGLPIIAPDDVGDDVDTVYVGLNPKDAPGIIEGVAPLHRRPRDFFFL